MDKMDCGCTSNRKVMKESTSTGQKHVVCVTVPANPEEIVEVMELVLQERVQQRTVEQIMDMLVTMHVETGQAQYGCVGCRCTSSQLRWWFRRSRQQAAAAQKPATTATQQRERRED